MEQQHTGQCHGGPDDGNLVTGVERFAFQVVYLRHLDGPSCYPSMQVLAGFYTWDPTTGRFLWERTS